MSISLLIPRSYYKDPLVKKQTFVNYLENVWYDEAVCFLPQSLVCGMMKPAAARCIIPDIFQITGEDLDFSERVFKFLRTCTQNKRRVEVTPEVELFQYI